MKLLPRLWVQSPPVATGGLSPTRTRRARRAVLTFLVAIVAAHLGLNVTLDALKPEWRDPEWGWRRKRLVPQARAGPVVVALGSSRTQMGLSPAALPAGSPVVFNLGQAGAGPLQMWLNYQRLKAAGVRPAAVLIEVMPASLAAAGGAEHLFHEQAYRLSAADVRRLAPYCHDPAALWERWTEVRAAPWHGYRFLLMSHAVPGFLPWQQRVDFQWRMLDRHGWLPFPFDRIGDADRARGTAKTRDQFADTLSDLHVSPVADRALRDLLAELRADGVPAALYRMPEGPTFRSWYAPTSAARLADYLGGICTEYAVPLFDASDWLDDDAFADGHHLMKHGATAFTERFGRECLSAWR